MSVSPGQILDNRYRVVELLGEGGFGAVYRVWDTRMDRRMALKENLDTSLEAQRQFKLEAQILFDLVHPNLPRVFDHFVIQGQGQYLVMDYVEGEDLQELLDKTGGRLPETRILDWARQVCGALEYLHAQNPPVIHRDIKPANIKITPQRNAMLVDFGIAKVYDPKISTTMGAKAVSPGYSPQEQYGMGATDERTDVYALGATLYHLLTGVQPQESIQRNIQDMLEPPRNLNPRVSLEVERAILKAMEPHPDQRFDNIGELKNSLVPRPPRFITNPISTQTTPLSVPQLPFGALKQQQRRLPWNLIGGVFGILAVVAIVLFIVFSGGGQATIDASSTETASALAVILTATQTEETPVAAMIPSATITEERSPTDTTTPTTPSTDTTIPPSATPSSEETHEPTALPLQIVDAHGIPMALVPAGEFLMGEDAYVANKQCEPIRMEVVGGPCWSLWFENEEPQHTVYLDDYYIDLYEVTNTLFVEFMNQMGIQEEDTNTLFINDRPDLVRIQKSGDMWVADNNYGDHPVDAITWSGAQTFCQWRGARLPTEAEWEKAARGTDGRQYPWGDEFIGRLANSCDKNCVSYPNQSYNDGFRITAPVGFYPGGVSPYGIYDMAGNVREWVSDWYSETYYSNSPYENPTGPENGDRRVVRGGKYSSIGYQLRTAYRGWSNDFSGFRCSRSPQ